ncbi:MAG: hypothetical protein ACTSU5_15420 [Promethearchaeota archaeon]
MSNPTHEKLDLETDFTLLSQVFDDPDKRYVILFLYELRSELLQDFANEKRLKGFEKIMSLQEEDEVYISSFKTFADDYDSMVDLFFELGLIKNVKNRRDWDKKGDDFVVKLVEGIHLDDGVVLCSVDALLHILRRNMGGWTKAKLNKVLKELRGIMCQAYPIIHPFIKIADEDYYIPNDLYYLLQNYANPYQVLRVDLTIVGVRERLTEWLENVESLIILFDPLLKKAAVKREVRKAIQDGVRDLVDYAADNISKLSKKFNPDHESELFEKWKVILNELLHAEFLGEELLEKVDGIRGLFTGKKRTMSYFEFMKKASFNEDDLLTNIRNDLLTCRKELIKLKKKLKHHTKKSIKLLNLDYEREILLEEDED